MSRLSALLHDVGDRFTLVDGLLIKPNLDEPRCGNDHHLARQSHATHNRRGPSPDTGRHILSVGRPRHDNRIPTGERVRAVIDQPEIRENVPPKAKGGPRRSALRLVRSEKGFS
jgi:hypothetical protein